MASTIDWPRFLEEAATLGRDLLRDPSPLGQELYLHALASLAVQLRGGVPAPKLYPLGAIAPGVRTAPVFHSVPFVVSYWRMEPGARVPPRSHPRHSVCTLCLGGEVLARHYEPAGVLPPCSSRARFQVVHTREELLGRGRVDTLSTVRDNLRALDAGPRGARGIDLATLHGPDAGAPYLTIAPRPIDPARRRYLARWR